jgi:hypothetical protein
LRTHPPSEKDDTEQRASSRTTRRWRYRSEAKSSDAGVGKVSFIDDLEILRGDAAGTWPPLSGERENEP